MPINPFRRVLSPSSGSRNGKTIPASDTNAKASTSKLPGVTIAAGGLENEATESNAMQSIQGSAGPSEPRLPEDSFRTSLIMPHLTKRFTLLRAPDGSMVTPEAMRAHLRAQRARARATGAPGTQCFLTEEEEDEIITQLRVQTEGDQSEIWDESVESQHIYETEKAGLGGTDGFGGWGSNRSTTDNAAQDVDDPNGNARIQSLAESLGELPSHAAGDAPGGGFFTSRSSARDLAYMRDVERSRAKNEEPLLATLDTSYDNSHIGDIPEEEDVENMPDELDGSGMPGDLLTVEKQAPMSRADEAVEDKPRSLALLRDDDDEANERRDGTTEKTRHSQLLTSLTPEAFNRVSTALAEVYGLVHGRIDDGDSDIDEAADETFQSSVQDDQMARQLADPLSTEKQPQAGITAVPVPSHSFLEAPPQEEYDDEDEEEEELADSLDGHEAPRRMRRSMDSDEHSFTSAHSEMLLHANDPFRAGPPVIHLPASTNRAAEPLNLPAIKDSGSSRLGNDVISSDNVAVVPTAPLNGWTTTSDDAPASQDVDDEAAPPAQDEQRGESLTPSAAGALTPSSPAPYQVSPMLAADQTIPGGIPGGPALAWSNSTDADTKPSSHKPSDAEAADLGISGSATAPDDERQATTPLRSPPQSSADGDGCSPDVQPLSPTPKGHASLLTPDHAAPLPSPLFAGLHFAGIGDRKSAIAAATAAGVAAASYVKQAQANTRAQKQSMDEQRHQAPDSDAAASATNGVDSHDSLSEVGNEVMSAGPSRITAFSPETATTPSSEVTPGVYSTSPGTETVRPWGQMATSTTTQERQTASAAASEVLSANAIAARSQHYFPPSSSRISKYADGFKPSVSPVLSQTAIAFDDNVAPSLAHGQKPSISASSDAASASSPSTTSRSDPSVASQHVPASAAALHSATQRESTPRHSLTKEIASKDDRQVRHSKGLYSVEEPPSMIAAPTGGKDGRMSNAHGDDEADDTFFDDEEDENVWDRVARNTSSPQRNGSSQVASPSAHSRGAAFEEAPVSIDHLRAIQDDLVRSAAAKQQGLPTAAFADGTAITTALVSSKEANDIPAVPALPSQQIPNGVDDEVNGGHAPASEKVDEMPGVEEAATRQPEQAALQRESTSSSIPTLSRGVSSTSFRSQVLYDVTTSHRASPPAVRNQKPVQGPMAALQDLHQRQRSSVDTERNASLAAMIEQTNRAHDAIPQSNENTEQLSAIADPIEEELDELDETFEEVSREDGFGGLVVETRSVPRSKSNDGTSASSVRSPRTMPAEDSSTHSPAVATSEHKDANDDSHGAVWSALPQQEEEVQQVAPQRDIAFDVASQARSATEALKGPNPQKPTLRSASLSKKARKKLGRHISQPELLMTSQRLDYAEPIELPDKALRKREGYESIYVPPSDPQAKAVPVHPLAQKKAEMSRASPDMRRPMTGISRTDSDNSNPTDYRAEVPPLPRALHRAASSGPRSPGLNIYRPLSPQQNASSPRLPSVGPTRDGSGEKTGTQRGLARFMSRIRSRDKLQDAAPVMAQVQEHEPERDLTPMQQYILPVMPLASPALSEDAAAQRRAAQAERKARRIESKRSAPALNSNRANYFESTAAGAASDAASQVSMPPPRSSSQRQKPRLAQRVASPTVEPPVLESPKEQESPDTAVLAAKPSHAREVTKPNSGLVAKKPAHARIKSPSPNPPAELSSRDSTTAGLGRNSLLPAELSNLSSPKGFNNAARDTIVRRTIIVSTYDPAAEERHKSMIMSQAASRKMEVLNGSATHSKAPSSPSKRTATLDGTSPTSIVFSDSTGHMRQKGSSPQSAVESHAPSAYNRLIDTSANSTLAVPETDMSMRTSNASGYGGSIYDLYADRGDGSSFEGSYANSQHHGSRAPSIMTERRGGLEPPSAMGTRRIEVTERADGSVVWQVIAGLADRNSTYSTSFAFDDRLSRRASGISLGSTGPDRHSRLSTADVSQDRSQIRPKDLVTNEDGRSLFTRSRGGKRKSFSYDGTPVPPLPGAESDREALDVSHDSKNTADITAEAPPRQSSLGHAKDKNGAESTDSAATESGQAATRIVYTSDAELAALLEQLAGPDKSSAKFAFQRVGENEPLPENGHGGKVIYAAGPHAGRGVTEQQHSPVEEVMMRSHDSLSIDVDVRRGAGGGGGWKASDRPDSEYEPMMRSSRAFDGPGRPMSIVTDAEMMADPTGALRQQRFKIEAEIYSLLQRGSMTNGAVTDKRASRA